ncbi:hypothetical protein OG943_43400 [Amycolatopsis sp. NBC_00345]|uniref:hypothetical protein n=1 Tax=Amycolatopsis sp. NBC_00345 TaxID=2975955 RepID=UPI002E262E6B
MTDRTGFRRACYVVARSTGATVLEFRLSSGTMPGFDQCLVDWRGRAVAVVRTVEAAVLAIAEPRAIDFADGHMEWGPLTFVDVPELVVALAEQSEFQVLTPAELDGPFDPAAWPHVLASDVKYWRPGNLGEALFNYWD